MKQTQKRTRKSLPNFILKIYDILEDEQYEDIISWNDEGNAFIIKNVNEFAEKVLPNYFKHKKYQSFVRQLNMYDFHKLRSEEGIINEFNHKLFRKGYKKLLSQIKRKKLDDQAEEYQQLSLKTIQEKDKISSQGLLKDMAAMKTKQENIAKICSLLVQQNNKLLSDNDQLWNQLIKQHLINIFINYQGQLNRRESEIAIDVIKYDYKIKIELAQI